LAGSRNLRILIFFKIRIHRNLTFIEAGIGF
jgi:hypothetical protein